MSATTTSAATSTARGGVRRPRRSTILITAVVLVAVLVVALGTRTATRDAPLDPDNPDGAGAQAVARVLADEGVDVEVARSADDLGAARVDAGTTVLVTSPDGLGPSTTERLLDDAADGSVVVARPGLAVLDLLGVEAPSAPADTGDAIGAGCDGVAERDLSGLSLDVATADAYPLPGCFPTADGAVVAQARPGLVLLGGSEILANDQVLRADNAAVALRLLGGGDRLVWYVPDPADLSAGEGVSLVSLLPDWLVPSLWLLLGASLVAIAWRARRFGPLATEPLPVSVRATETTRSRGRLYHRARDRGHAARTLRAATRDRVAARLGVPSARGPGPDPVATDASRRTGWDAGEVAWLLDPDAPPPAGEVDLIMLADRLAELDREVRRS